MDILRKTIKLLDNDKGYHFLGGGFLALAASGIATTYGMGIVAGYLLGVGVSLIAGLAKEAYDKFVKKGKWDWLDLLATVGGGVLCSILGCVLGTN